MAGKRMTALISAHALYALSGNPDLRILDCSYAQPPSGHGIQAALDFDIDTVADTSCPRPHTLPAPEIFAAHVGRMGIGNNTMVIVYDRAGIAMAAARVWWMFRVFGHDNVRVLDGGLPAWMNAGYALSPKVATPPAPALFKACFRPELFKTVDDVKNNINGKSFLLLDARSADRFSGTTPEPRPGLSSGHIPGSANIPFTALIDAETGQMKPLAALSSVFSQRSIDLYQPLACSCGSGVTACVVALALYELGHHNAAIYGGSWVEWGSNPELPKAQGDAISWPKTQNPEEQTRS